jgi:hypothetical protein
MMVRLFQKFLVCFAILKIISASFPNVKIGVKKSQIEPYIKTNLPKILKTINVESKNVKLEPFSVNQTVIGIGNLIMNIKDSSLSMNNVTQEQITFFMGNKKLDILISEMSGKLDFTYEVKNAFLKSQGTKGSADINMKNLNFTLFTNTLQNKKDPSKKGPSAIVNQISMNKDFKLTMNFKDSGNFENIAKFLIDNLYDAFRQVLEHKIPKSVTDMIEKNVTELSLNQELKGMYFDIELLATREKESEIFNITEEGGLVASFGGLFESKDPKAPRFTPVGVDMPLLDFDGSKREVSLYLSQDSINSLMNAKHYDAPLKKHFNNEDINLPKPAQDLGYTLDTKGMDTIFETKAFTETYDKDGKVKKVDFDIEAAGPASLLIDTELTVRFPVKITPLVRVKEDPKETDKPLTLQTNLLLKLITDESKREFTVKEATLNESKIVDPLPNFTGIKVNEVETDMNFNLKFLIKKQKLIITYDEIIEQIESFIPDFKKYLEYVDEFHIKKQFIDLVLKKLPLEQDKFEPLRFLA